MTVFCGLCNEPFLYAKRGNTCPRCKAKIGKLALKIRAIQYMGGKCKRCGRESNLRKDIGAFDFHHIGHKNFSITSKIKAYSWAKIQAELDLCILLCAVCHRLEHTLDHSDDLYTRAYKAAEKKPVYKTS